MSGSFCLHYLSVFGSSSVNLIAAMGAIANIARQRPDYMSRVVQTFEALQGKFDW